MEGGTYQGPSRAEAEDMDRGTRCRQQNHDARLADLAATAARLRADLGGAAVDLANASQAVQELLDLTASAAGLLADFRHGIPPPAMTNAKRAADDVLARLADAGVVPRRVFS